MTPQYYAPPVDPNSNVSDKYLIIGAVVVIGLLIFSKNKGRR